MPRSVAGIWHRPSSLSEVEIPLRCSSRSVEATRVNSPERRPHEASQPLSAGEATGP